MPERLEPNWDLTPYFPAFGGDAYRAFRDALAADLEALPARVPPRVPAGREGLERFADVLLQIEDASARSAHLGSYLGCLSAADARDEAVQRERAAHAARRAQLETALAGVRAALRDADDERFAQLVADPRLEGAAYMLARLRRAAAWTLAPELERLAAELDVTGLSAWGRLYDQVSGNLEFELARPGHARERMPIAMTRTLLEDADPAVRSAAFRGANHAWEGVADVMAASLNAIAGTRLTLYRWRGIPDFLDPALFDAAISRETLDTLLEAVESRAELPRRYLRRKAERLGVEKLGFQDLLAPLPETGTGRIPFDAARERILRAFGAFHPGLEAFARQAFERRWIDYEPRRGKRPGGFCTSSPLIGESRVFLTYNGSLGDLQTLAHELGHAYHNHVMRDMRPWARRYPMTLAETASTFAEQLVSEAVLEDPDASEADKLHVLDARLLDAAVFLLNIPMRFHFERALYAERANGEVGVSRLRELMVEAQRRSYGDCLAEDGFDPWYWASKLHFYITGVSFYNFPYTFGYLFSRGIFARARSEGPAFLPRYDELLRLTGSDAAESVAARGVSVDLTAPGFWLESIGSIEADLERFLERTGGG
ncbi:MAG: M3 family oligoendopeptidase [Deltaproteobacteria bacterium]|nr:MAG: M3 family oligoendopeptidase [Deltaproteobacteria bacterium]